MFTLGVPRRWFSKTNKWTRVIFLATIIIITLYPAFDARNQDLVCGGVNETVWGYLVEIMGGVHDQHGTISCSLLNKVRKCSPVTYHWFPIKLFPSAEFCHSADATATSARCIDGTFCLESTRVQDLLSASQSLSSTMSVWQASKTETFVTDILFCSPFSFRANLKKKLLGAITVHHIKQQLFSSLSCCFLCRYGVSSNGFIFEQMISTSSNAVSRKQPRKTRSS